MNRKLIKTAVLVLALAGFSAVASADDIGVGFISYDATTPGVVDQLNLTNLTGTSALPTDFPITTELTFDITSVVVNLSVGGPVDLTAADFTTDAYGDEDCTAAACNLIADNITSVVLTGTLAPVSGLTGLPAGDTGIQSYMSDGGTDTTVTFTPAGSAVCGSDYLTAGCDAAAIYAVGTSGVAATPEPGTWALLGIGLIGLFAIGRKRLRNAGGQFSTAASY